MLNASRHLPVWKVKCFIWASGYGVVLGLAGRGAWWCFVCFLFFSVSVFLSSCCSIFVFFHLCLTTEAKQRKVFPLSTKGAFHLHLKQLLGGGLKHNWRNLPEKCALILYNLVLPTSFWFFCYCCKINPQNLVQSSVLLQDKTGL